MLVGGFVLLIVGADWLVRGAASLARTYKVSELAIGLTIVAFGTSAPELVVNAIASFDGRSEMVFGNVIGSNNFNLLLILGIAALIHPLAVRSRTVRWELPLSLLAAALLLFLVNDATIFGHDREVLLRWEAVVLLGLFIGFIAYVFKNLKEDLTGQALVKELPLWLTFTFIIVGLTGLGFGGRFVVDGAVDIARELNVSEKVIGLTIVAAGTSLPELATTAVAALRGRTDLAVGNIVGSNIFNIFLILGVSALVNPIEYNALLNTDLLVLMGGTVFVLAAVLTGKSKRIDRWEALILLAAFVAYMAFLIWRK